jgi:hypothetical protein
VVKLNRGHSSGLLANTSAIQFRDEPLDVIGDERGDKELSFGKKLQDSKS